MLATRVASALVFGPLLLAAGYLGGPLLWLLTAVVVAIGFFELDKLFSGFGWRAQPGLGLPFALGLVGAAAAGRPDLMPAILTSGALTAIIAPTVLPRRVSAHDAVGVVFGLVYLGWLVTHFVLLRQLPTGRELFLLGLIGTWAFDSGSYFAGRAFGRRKLAPLVSPGKTVEGLVGGLILGGVVITWLGRAWLHLAWVPGLALAAAVMAAAQLGDLAESALKRRAGVKDSGTLIPGHGGVLDRFDSLLAVLPVVYYLAYLWLGVGR